MTLSLFEGLSIDGSLRESLGPGAVVLRGFALHQDRKLWAAVQAVSEQAPFRQMVTPGGLQMSVAMTNCGSFGWVSDQHGYRYAALDPEGQRPWPSMPKVLLQLSEAASRLAGFSGFVPDSCLINRYQPGTKLSLHQDKNEVDFEQPIVSVSLGLPACFLFGGSKRSDAVRRVALDHGDVVVWGGPARLRYHGIAPIQPGYHSLLGAQRINLTLRRAGPVGCHNQTRSVGRGHA